MSLIPSPYGYETCSLALRESYAPPQKKERNEWINKRIEEVNTKREKNERRWEEGRK